MMNWIRRRKLIALVKKLAIYNDKGITWRNHSEQEAEIERDRLLSLINHQVSLLGEGQISDTLKSAISNGNIKTDITGKYIECAKQQKL